MPDKLLKILMLTFCLCAYSCHATESLKVAFLSPAPKEQGFWGDVENFMQAVAEDLNIQLNVIYSKGNTYSIKKDGLEIIEATDKPDYFITGYWEGATNKLLSAAAENGVKFFIVNTRIDRMHRKLVGFPRGKYKNWIGHMSPNDKRAGFDLASMLVAEARSKSDLNKTRRIKIAGVTGDENSSVAQFRHSGLKSYAEQDSSVKLLKVVMSTWNAESAAKSTAEIIQEFPDINVFWFASDALARGGMQAIKALQNNDGQAIFVGGMDWTREALTAIESNKMVVSLGGHFMEGGWALLLIHDFHYGFDFVDDLGIQINTRMQAVTKDNVQQYKRALDEKDWSKINFKNYSKKYNSKLGRYHFAAETLVNSITVHSIAAE